LKLLRSSFAAAGPTHEGVAEQHPEAEVCRKRQHLRDARPGMLFCDALEGRSSDNER